MKAFLSLIAIPVCAGAQPREEPPRQLLLEVAAGRSAFSAPVVEIESDSAFIGPSPFTPVSSLPFAYDDNDSVSRVSVAYEVVPGFSIELAYSEFGEFWPRTGFLSGPNDDQETVSAVLEMEQLTIQLRFEHELTRHLFGVWKLGLSGNEFEVETVRLPLSEGLVFLVNPLVIDSIGIPSEENGVTLGVGIHWQSEGRLGFGATYHRHDVQVGILESVDTSIIVRF